MPMISPMQRTVLNEILSTDGIFLDPILNQSSLSKMQKYCVLQAALNQNCFDFLTTLDKLSSKYHFTDNQPNWILSLKAINDLAHNSEMVDSDYGVKRVLHHCFKNIGAETEQLNDPNSDLSKLFKKEIRKQVFKTIKLKAFDKKKYHKFIKALDNALPDPAWRKLVDLPLSQQHASSNSFLGNMTDSFLWFKNEAKNFPLLIWETAEFMAAYTGGVTGMEIYEETNLLAGMELL